MDSSKILRMTTTPVAPVPDPIRRVLWAIALLQGLPLGTTAIAAQTQLDSAVPPFLSIAVPPNLVLTLDNSSSMARAYLPEAVGHAGASALTSPDVNRLYYDPRKTYVPGLTADNQSFGHASFSAPSTFYPYMTKAREADPSLGDVCEPSLRDLASSYRAIKVDVIAFGCDQEPRFVDGKALTDERDAGPAYYHSYNADHYYSLDESRQSGARCTAKAVADPDFFTRFAGQAETAGAVTAAWAVCRSCRDGFGDDPTAATPDSCFDKILIGSEQDLALGACAAGAVCREDRRAVLGIEDEVEAARTNFANWFVYYRSRFLVAKTVLSRVMQGLEQEGGHSIRLAYQGMHGGELSAGRAFDQLGAVFGDFDENKQAFYQWLYALSESPDGAPLQASHIRAGQFAASQLARASSIALHRQPPAGYDFAANSRAAACRNNFHLLLTDGAWSDRWDSAAEECPDAAETVPDEAGGACWITSHQDGRSHSDLPENRYGITHYDASAAATQIYSDDNVGMLADAVFYYWRHDLDGDDRNNLVPPLIESWEDDLAADSAENFWNPRNDPATWQHLSFYAIGLGVDGAVAPLSTWPFGTYSIDLNGQSMTLTLADVGFPDSALTPYVDTTVDADGDAIPVPGPFSGIAVSEAVTMPEAAKLDDLYHAALNGRGRYFSVSDPTELMASFADVLATVSAAADPAITAASGAIAVSSAQLDDETLQFQTLVSVSNWQGELHAYQISLGEEQPPCPGQPRGSPCQTRDSPYWSASEQIPTASERTILTLAQGVPTPFRPGVFDDLSRAQKLGLLGCGPDVGIPWTGERAFCNEVDSLDAAHPRRVLAEARIDYLRGDASNETASGGEFRDRDGHLLGDMLGSNALVVGPPSSRYTDATYATFRGVYGDRAPVVYVGANDGMLHAFSVDKTAGRELFAYVPEGIYRHLSDLTDPAYGAAHGLGPPKRAFADGPIVVGDAEFTDRRGQSGWKSVLLGSFGYGAQGVYALNVTSPEAVTEADPETLPLWEFNDASGSDADDGALDGRDMGYSLAAPVIVRIDDDLGTETAAPTWVALVSNGYDNTSEAGEVAAHCTDADSETNCTVSQSGNAVLYVLALGGDDSTRILAKMDTGIGFDDDPRPSSNRANGLAPVTAVDIDGDLIVDRAYAGDLFGHLWRFDLIDTTAPPLLLFSAVDDLDAPQPITSKVVVHRHPSGIGTLVLFGTGQLLNSSDKNDTQLQSFYAIWDDDGLVHPATAGGFDVPRRADLLPQAFEAETLTRNAGGVATARGRTSTDRAVDWGAGGHRGWYIDLTLADGPREGERVILAPALRGGRVLFVSSIPSCCQSGGLSWINALDANDGSRLSVTPFDYDLDGGFSDSDLLAPAVASGADQGIVGTSIRLLSEGGTGLYAAPAQLGLGGGDLLDLVSDSEGNLILLRESTALDWRTWLQLR